MKKKQKEYLKRRDNNRCGIHLGGCGEEFKSKDEITINHMISKSFKRNSNSIFHKAPFLQPTHRHCSANIKRRQIIGYPTFNCNCHYSYFNIEEGNLEILYKTENNEWRSEVFLTNMVSESEVASTMIDGKRGNKIGFGRMSKDGTSATFYLKEKNQYHIENFSSLLKCKRLDKAWKETKLINFKDCDKQEQSKIYLTLGDICVENDDYNKSMIYCDRAIELNPQFFEAYNNRGILKGQLGQHREAIEDFNKVINLSPNCANAYNNIGRVKNNLGQYEEAIENYTNAKTLLAKAGNMEMVKILEEEIAGLKKLITPQ